MSNQRFYRGQIVRHKVTGGKYRIILDADFDFLTIESSVTPAYAYKDITGGQVWVRPKTEMEDGRFEVVE